ncbi:hypothetical protein NA56DRAFT_587960, partial [Hyaloscypha hepaticicola]
IIINCEMGTVISGESEFIHITLINYFLSTILVNSLIYPNVEISHYNTRFSGIIKKDIKVIYIKNTCFRERDQARAIV